MPSERQHQKTTCKECECQDCSVTEALAFRTDAWKTANRNLTDAAKEWPTVGADDDGGRVPPTVTPIDALILANWLCTGEIGS